MTVTVYAKHLPYPDAVRTMLVADEMQLGGPPTIRVVQYDGKYFALEGSHRLALAHANGIVPKLVVLPVHDDDSGELNTFWQRVAPTLPRYDFEHVEVLVL